MKRLPLRFMLVVPFVIIVCTAVVLTGALSFKSGRQAVSEVASQLRSEIELRVSEDLIRFFTIPYKVNQLNQDAVSQGFLNVDFLSTWEDYLFYQA